MRIEFEFEKCILCLKRHADSWEHVIPRSLGGRLKVRVLCTACNNTFGSQFVSALRSDPLIRLALENLKDELPDLYRSAQDGLPFVGKAADGSIVRLSRKGDQWRILTGPGARGSRVQDTRDAKKALRRILNKQGLSNQEMSRWVELFASLDEDVPLGLPGGQTFVKRDIPPLAPELGPQFVSERVPALIAYEFLALLIGDLIYQDSFNEIRQYIRTGACSDRCEIQCLSSGKYAPIHAVDLQPEETHFTVFVRFFRWLVFAVKFYQFSYLGPDAVYFEDLKQGRSLIAISRADARDGKWYIL